MRRTIPDFSPDGLKRRLQDQERQIADLQRMRNAPPQYVEQETGRGFPITYGSDTILDGSATATIPHDLGGAPTSLAVTPRGLELLAVTNRDAINFEVSRAGTTGALQFDWIAAGVDSPTGYAELVLADAPLLYLPLDDPAGTTAESRVGTNGTYFGSPSLLATGPSAEIPYGVSLDGTNDYVLTGDNFGAILGAGMTFEMWIKNTNTANRKLLGTVNVGTSTILAIGVNDPGGGQISMSVRSSGGLQRNGGSTLTPINDGGWHHYVFVLFGNAPHKVYIDGAPWPVTMSINQNASATSAFDYPVTLGAWNLRGSIGSFFPGQIAAFAVYDYELTSVQVQNHYTTAGV